MRRRERRAGSRAGNVDRGMAGLAAFSRRLQVFHLALQHDDPPPSQGLLCLSELFQGNVGAGNLSPGSSPRFAGCGDLAAGLFPGHGSRPPPPTLLAWGSAGRAWPALGASRCGGIHRPVARGRRPLVFPTPSASAKIPRRRTYLNFQTRSKLKWAGPDCREYRSNGSRDPDGGR